ncbi:MAG: GGDEF domain-containing protein, partial [Alphaproteobacteria bacterium]|nr:GGDEF domain-containing protein [Alphaproteobacteria bacterium]
MPYHEARAIAQRWAADTMAALERHGLAPNPNVFTVFYSCVSEQHPDVRNAVEAHLKANGSISDEAAAEIFERFFGVLAGPNALIAASRRLEEAIAKITAITASATKEASSYTESLGSFNEHLSDRGDQSDGLRSMVEAIIGETRTMLAVNRQLEDRLTSSTREITELRHNLDELKRESATDALTGIANRRQFDVALTESAVAAREKGEPLCLCMIDIDLFKNFNDNYGHAMGDQVLKLVAKTLVENVKGRDTAARYGGEEFSVILPDTTISSALKVAEAIRMAVERKKVVNRRTGVSLGKITLSIGVAEYRLGEPLGRFVHRADEALYVSKRNGRNQVTSESETEDAEVVA